MFFEYINAAWVLIFLLRLFHSLMTDGKLLEKIKFNA